MNRIFSYKALFILTFLYLQSIDLKVLPEKLKVFPEEKGKYLICPNGNSLSKKYIPALPYLEYTNEQKPNYWTRPYHWKISSKREFYKSEAFNSEIIIYDGILSTKTKYSLMPIFLDKTNITSSYKSKEIFLDKEEPSYFGYQYITYIFKNAAGKNLTLKQRLDDTVKHKMKTDNGIEFTIDGEVGILATIYCDKNNSLVFRDIQEVPLPSSKNEYGEEIKTKKTIFWIRELRFKTNVLDKKEPTFDL